MKKQIFAAIAVSLLIIPLSVNALPDNGNQNLTESNLNKPKHLARGQRMGRDWGMEKMLEQLDLTPEQSQQIDGIKEESRNENKGLFQEMQTYYEEMRSLLASDASVEQLREQHEKMQALHQQLASNRFETMLQIREILTPEQRSQIAELMENKSGRRGEKDFSR